jgi:predicted Zn-dependent protease
MILGGVITTTLEWRWVFDINVPIRVAVSLLSIKYISRSTTRRTGSHESLDILGGISITAGLQDRNKPDTGNKLLAICDFDANSSGLNFIFGQAQIDGRVSAIYLPRLRQEFYGLNTTVCSV